MKKQFLSAFGTALLTGSMILPSMALPVLASQKDAGINAGLLANITAWEPDPNLASFHITYVDPNGLTVGSQVVRVPADETVTLEESDLEIPEGFYLNEYWQTYQSDPGQWLYVEFAVAPLDDQLAVTMYNTDGLDPDQSTLTLNYYDEGGNLISSENYQKAAAGAGISSQYFYNGTDYALNVPEGYELVSGVDDVYEVPYHGRVFADVLITPAVYEFEEYSEENNEVSELSAAEETVDVQEDTAPAANSVNTGFDSRIAIPTMAMAASGLMFAWLKKRK